MPIAHIRELSKFGVVTDPDSFDIPIQAFSMGVNCRFRNKKLSRGPVYRNVRALSLTDPRHLVGSSQNSGVDQLFIGYKSGRIYKATSTTETNYSPTGYVDNAVDSIWTDTTLANVAYSNREDRVPWSLSAADPRFQVLAGGWNSTWRARLLRACGGALVALNVTKGATNAPTMVKTSSIPLAGAIPSSWDQTDPATNATENILAEMAGPIVDATPLGQNLIIYGAHESWAMQPVGGIDVFDYTKLPFNKGAISANCSIEIAGKHYVFGNDDIWMHDGVSEVSICEGITRSFIFSNLNAAKASRFFVTHNATLKELSFNHVSGNQFAAFASSDACNWAAIYNYVDKTWTFDDLPLVYSGSRSNLDATLTYATVTSTYDTIGGTYLDQDDGSKKSLLYVGDVSALFGLTARLYALDNYGVGSTLAFTVDAPANPPMYLERDGIDLDEIEADLKDYKNISSIWPQARIDADAEPLQFAFGASDYFGVVPTFGSYMDYDGMSNYKLDPNISGRYLSMRILFDDYKSVTLSGFDALLIKNGSQ